MKKRIINILLITMLLISSNFTSIFAEELTVVRSIDIYARLGVKIKVTKPDGSTEIIVGKGESVVLKYEMEETFYEYGTKIYKFEELSSNDEFIENDLNTFQYYISCEYGDDDKLTAQDIYSFLINQNNPNDKLANIQFKDKYKCNIIWIDGMDESIVYKGDDNGKPIFFDKGTNEPAYPPNPTKDGFVFDGWDRYIISTYPDGTPKEIVVKARWKQASSSRPFDVTYIDDFDPDNIIIIKDTVYKTVGVDEPPRDPYDERYCPPDPTREGYIFAGWTVLVYERYGDGNAKHIVYRANWIKGNKPPVPNTKLG